MAQWQGQFSGRTHATKVEDIERTLLTSIDSLTQGDEQKRKELLQNTHAIAKKLLTVRLKMLRTRMTQLSEPGRPQDQRQTASLKATIDQMMAEGMDAIMREFGIDDLTAPSDDQGNA